MSDADTANRTNILRDGPSLGMTAVATVSVKEKMRLPWFLGSRAVFALLDQGMFAGSNFIIGVQLARSLSPGDYGIFTVAYSVLLLLGTIHTAALTGPMLVFGAGKYASRFRGYLSFLLWAHAALTGVLSLFLATAGIIVWQLGHPALARTLMGVAAAVPLFLLFWLMRSVFYTRMRAERAALNSAFYLVLVVASLFFLHRFNLLSPVRSFLAMGVAAASAAIVSLQLANSQKFFGDGPDVAGDRWDPMAAFRDHLRYAKWALAGSGTDWLAANAQYFVLSWSIGLGGVAVMKILDTALQPGFQAFVAGSRLIQPVLASHAHHSRAQLFGYTTRIMLVWSSGGALVCLLVWAFAPRILPALYGPTYAQYHGLLAWYSLILIPEAAVTVLWTLLLALVRTDIVFASQFLFVGLLIVAFLAGARHGVPGIIASRVVVSYLFPPVAMFIARRVCAGLVKA